jgi:uncharacterized membrane protein
LIQVIGAQAQEPEVVTPVAPAPLLVPPPPTTSIVTSPPTPVIVNVPSPAEPPAPIEGLWLTTDFPALGARLGEEVRFELMLQNRNLPPRRIDLSVEGLPNGWTYEFEGGGRPVTAALVGLDQNIPLSLRLWPTADAATGTFDFRVVGHATPDTLDLPISLNLAEARPARMTLEPKLPALRGAPRSTFDFQVTATNESAEDQAFNLLADAPEGFDTTFAEQYGSQELTSVPVKAGESKELRVSVKLPQDAAAGRYPVVVQAVGPKSAAETTLVLDVTGQPSLALAGPEGRLSGEANAGKERAFSFTLRNSGTSPARAVRLETTAPAGWQIHLDPKEVAAIEPGQELPVSLAISPAEKAIAGDYVVSVRAVGEGASAGADLRVTVLTSTLWGLAGLGVIGAAVIVLAVAVTRYGRR